MTNVTLDSLLASLEENGLAKQAAEAPKATTATTSVGKELENILSKQANEVNLVNAQQKGQAIADSVVALLKQASEGGNRVITETAAQVAGSSAGIAETPREGNSITNTLQGLVANGIANGAVRPDALDEHLDQGGDEGRAGLHQPGSDEHDNHISHEGSEADDEVEKTAALIELVDNGVDFNTAVDLIKQAEVEIQYEEFEQVKQAAVVGLLNEGMDIESAVQLVKVAMELDGDLVKQAVNSPGFAPVAIGEDAAERAANRVGQRERIRAGLDNMLPLQRDIDHAARVQAMNNPKAEKKFGKATAAADSLWEKVKGKGALAKEDFRALAGASGYRMDALKGLAKNPLVYGPAAAVAVGGAGYAALKHREKRAAAVEFLLGQGYDVQTALDMVDGE